jgi:hypothetical protein
VAAAMHLATARFTYAFYFYPKAAADGGMSAF